MIIFGIYDGAVTVHVTELLIASSGCFLMVLFNSPTWLYRGGIFGIFSHFIMKSLKVSRYNIYRNNEVYTILEQRYLLQQSATY